MQINQGYLNLWKNEQWAKEFAVFIKRITNGCPKPDVIEIHPPFNDYCTSINRFFDLYQIFEYHIQEHFGPIKILFENRCGTVYTGGKFLVSNADDVIRFCEYLINKNTSIQMIIDYPQLISGMKMNMNRLDINALLQFNENIKFLREYVGGFHIWGKRKSVNGRWIPHNGDLNTFFSGDKEQKKLFLDSLVCTYDDEIPRYFVPEVNSANDDLVSIVNDLRGAGVIFI